MHLFLALLIVLPLALGHSNVDEENLQKNIRTAAGTRFPPPVTYYMRCGTKWTNNITWTNEEYYDYFAVVNASEFTVIATRWVAQPSGACEPGAYAAFIPISNSGASYGPQEKYFISGESFNFTVSSVRPPVKQFDFVFFGNTGTIPCNYQITMEAIEIAC